MTRLRGNGIRNHVWPDIDPKCGIDISNAAEKHYLTDSQRKRQTLRVIMERREFKTKLIANAATHRKDLLHNLFENPTDVTSTLQYKVVKAKHLPQKELDSDSKSKLLVGNKDVGRTKNKSKLAHYFRLYK